ncbi:MAG: hypothetical protein R3C42_09470 [Parvularculaceae bacterium]|nr:tetratricopeptide repeat protein [Parvularculaceae bacterium]
MAVRNLAMSKPATRFAGVAVCALLMSACASSGKNLHADGSKVDYKSEVGVFTNPGSAAGDMDPIAAAAYWGSAYDRNPKDVSAAINYSAALRKISSNEEAVKVMTRVANANPENAEANLEAGKTLVEAGRAFEAVRFLEKASDLAPRDWRTFSAFGVALDQIGEHKLARTKYDMALVFSPGAPMLLNNKGLSFALDGNLEEAKKLLRAAAASRGSDARIRQNLALVLAIKGEMREAERLARSDLPPQIADQNIDYFRALMNQPAYWQSLAADNVETPSFDAPAQAAPMAAPKTTAPAPALKEEPKEEEKKPSAPIALKESATTPTNASAEAPAPTPLIKGAHDEDAPAPTLKDD